MDVVDNSDQSRFEARSDGDVVGFVQYRRAPDTVVLLHTEVSDTVAGQGVGSRLVRGTLDALLAEGITVVDQCPFIGRFLDRHPGEYDTVVRGR